MTDVIKIALVIIGVVLSVDVFKLISQKIISNLTNYKMKILFVICFVIFMISTIISIYSLIKYQTLEWQAFSFVLISYSSLKALKNNGLN